jgi:hypothetical protein
MLDRKSGLPEEYHKEYHFVDIFKIPDFQKIFVPDLVQANQVFFASKSLMSLLAMPM